MFTSRTICRKDTHRHNDIEKERKERYIDRESADRENDRERAWMREAREHKLEKRYSGSEIWGERDRA